MEKELHISMLKDIFDICVVDSINENKNPHEVCEIFFTVHFFGKFRNANKCPI